MTPANDSSRTVTMRTWFCTWARPEMMRPVWPPEMPKTYSIPASASTRATSTRDGVSSFSIRSTGIASSLGGLAEACYRPPAMTTGLRQQVQSPPRHRPGPMFRLFEKPMNGSRPSPGWIKKNAYRLYLPARAAECHICVMVPLSVLDLSPIVEGGDAGQSLRNSLDLARHVEALGYPRLWMAEHHNLPGIASAATAVALAHVAAGTDPIRIGAGGIMLPNHAPLMVAEQFGTLASLHPGRVELGLGRAPGSDQNTLRAMRRNLMADVDQFPQDVLELMAYFEPPQPGQAIQA